MSFGGGTVNGQTLSPLVVGEGEGGKAAAKVALPADRERPAPNPFPHGGGEAPTFWHQCQGRIWGKA